MDVQFLASIAPIVRDDVAARDFYQGALGLSFEGGEADYKFTGTVNHRSPTFPDDLRAACGDTGVHVFFDNVGGPLP